MVALIEREYYQPNSGILWTRLPTLLLGTLGVAVAGGWLLSFLHLRGWYVTLLFPILVSVGIGLTLELGCKHAHCRYRWFAGGIGGTAGFVCYLGYYYFEMIQKLPPGMEWRIDLLPGFIHFKLANDVIQIFDFPGIGNQNRQPSFFFNCLFESAEFAFCIAFPSSVGWSQTKKFFSLEAREWMTRETFYLSPGSGLGFAQSLTNGRVSEFLARAVPADDVRSASNYHLDYVSNASTSPLEYPIYLTVEDLSPGKFLWWNIPYLQTVLSGIRLTPEEILAIYKRFPKLKKNLESQISGLDEINPTAPDALEANLLDIEPATMERIEPEFRGAVRTSGYQWKVIALNMVDVHILRTGGGLGLLGGWFVKNNPSSPMAFLILVGVVLFLYGSINGLFYPFHRSHRWLSRRLKEEISKRKAPYVRADDPDVYSVQLISRENFLNGRAMSPDDILLMKFDERHKLILMEGDEYRYKIPFAAIRHSRVQRFLLDQTGFIEIWTVRLIVHFEDGRKEMLLREMETKLSQRENRGRKITALEISRRIQTLRGITDSTNPT
ncbi:MAG: hypothetical protein KDA68_03775 [Planctomycetaceae bacterium]|nr:hypothetical protein [Planctomycetaceae bacterium]